MGQFCEQCGAKIESGMRFCQSCGAPVPQDDPAEESNGPSSKTNAGDGGSAFCEQCGARLEPGLRFCQNCGAPAPQTGKPDKKDGGKSISRESYEVFNDPDWENNCRTFARNHADGEIGIILTDIKDLAGELNCDCEQIRDVIDSYVDACAERGVYYAVLDAGDNEIKCIASSVDTGMYSDNVGALTDLIATVVPVLSPKYLFIIGDNTVIPVQTWSNGCSDSDPSVGADLPYTTLNCESPWDGVTYDFDAGLQAGRLPVWQGESLVQVSRYFENAARNSRFAAPVPYGLSALVWQDTSAAIFYRDFAKGRIDKSPDITRDSVGAAIPENANLFLFNLHGDNDGENPCWYGQDGGNYPEAFSPDNAAALASPNVIGVEACYGARYVDYSIKDSILLSAVTSNTVGLLGSSCIAYGTSAPPVNCADVMVGEFLRQVKDGATLGESFKQARCALFTGDVDDAVLKTLAEFSLYGDPSLCPFGAAKAKSKGLFGKMMKAMPDVKRTAKMAVPDVRKAVHMELVNTNQKGLDFVLPEKFRSQKGLGADPEIYRMSNSGLYQAVTKQTAGGFTSVTKTYFKKDGKITKEYVSK